MWLFLLYLINIQEIITDKGTVIYIHDERLAELALILLFEDALVTLSGITYSKSTHQSTRYLTYIYSKTLNFDHVKQLELFLHIRF